MTYLLAYLSIMALALALAKVGVTGAYLVAYAMLEPCKRIASFLLYPVAYHYRDKVRSRRVLSGLLCLPSSLWAAPLWLLLDDSVLITYDRENSPEDFKYPAWILARKSDAWRSWWWAAVRNSCVNFGNLNAFLLDSLAEDPKHEGENFFIVRTFINGKRPYSEFILFGRRNQIGWISCGRFEIDIMKRCTK